MERNIRYLKASQKNGEHEYVSLSFWWGTDICCKIFRKECPDFVFDYDDIEYFDRISPEGADLLFEGDMHEHYSELVYEDHTVLPGMVYAYWVEYHGMIAGPAPVRVRDHRMCMNQAEISRKLHELSEYPDTDLIQIGETVRHKPLEALLCGNRECMICCLGTVHAGESGPEILLSAVEFLLNNQPDLLKKTGIAILPAVNLDMRDEMAGGNPIYLRKNANGVDLNRNFPTLWDEVTYGYNLSSAAPGSATYRGPYPASEPETKAVMSLIEKIQPKLVLSYHWLGSITGDYMLCGGTKKDDPTLHSFADPVVRQYSEAFRHAAGLPLLENPCAIDGCSPGSLAEWCHSKKILAFDLEGCNIPEYEICKKDLATYEQLKTITEGHIAALSAMLKSI